MTLPTFSDEGTLYEATCQFLSQLESRGGDIVTPQYPDGSGGRNSNRSPVRDATPVHLYQRVCSLAGVVS